MTQLDKDIIEFAKISSIAYGRLKENMELGKNFTNEFETNKIIINKFGKQEYKKETLNKKYKIIDIANNPKTGFQALALMDESGKYIIAFRGTNDKKDIKVDIQIGKNNINPQHKDAKEFTQKILNQITKDKNIPFYEAKKYLTLVGHSLGGIHTQQIAAVNKIKGFAFNPYGANRLISMPKNPCFPSIGISTCDMIMRYLENLLQFQKKLMKNG